MHTSARLPVGASSLGHWGSVSVRTRPGAHSLPWLSHQPGHSGGFQKNACEAEAASVQEAFVAARVFT